MKSLEWFRINVFSHDTTWESTSAPVFIVCGSTLHSSSWAPLSILAHLRDGPTLRNLTNIISRNADKHEPSYVQSQIHITKYINNAPNYQSTNETYYTQENTMITSIKDNGQYQRKYAYQPQQSTKHITPNTHH